MRELRSAGLLAGVGLVPVDELPMGKKETPLEIFERIQREGTGISPKVADKFNAEVRRWRRASGRNRG